MAAWCPKRGVDRAEAAVYLLRAFWADLIASYNEAAPDFVECGGVLTNDAVAMLIEELWPGARA